MSFEDRIKEIEETFDGTASGICDEIMSADPHAPVGVPVKRSERPHAKITKRFADATKKEARACHSQGKRTAREIADAYGYAAETLSRQERLSPMDRAELRLDVAVAILEVLTAHPDDWFASATLDELIGECAILRAAERHDITLRSVLHWLVTTEGAQGPAPVRTKSIGRVLFYRAGAETVELYDWLPADEKLACVRRTQRIMTRATAQHARAIRHDPTALRQTGVHNTLIRSDVSLAAVLERWQQLLVECHAVLHREFGVEQGAAAKELHIASAMIIGRNGT